MTKSMGNQGGPGGTPGAAGPPASGAPGQAERAGGPGVGAAAGGPGGGAPGGRAGGFASMFKAGRVWGPQVEIAPPAQDGGDSTAGLLFGEAMPELMITPVEKRINHKYFKANNWNHYRVVAKGPRIQIWINNQPILDFDDANIYKTHAKGFIGLQLHFSTGDHSVYFRDIRIKPL